MPTKDSALVLVILDELVEGQTFRMQAMHAFPIRLESSVVIVALHEHILGHDLINGRALLPFGGSVQGSHAKDARTQP